MNTSINPVTCTGSTPCEPRIEGRSAPDARYLDDLDANVSRDSEPFRGQVTAPEPSTAVVALTMGAALVCSIAAYLVPEAFVPLHVVILGLVITLERSWK